MQNIRLKGSARAKEKITHRKTPAPIAFAVIIKRHLRGVESLGSPSFHATPAQIHQVRVSIRQVLTAIWLFKTVTQGVQRDKLKSELHWLQSELSAIRDLDTLIARIQRLRKNQPVGTAIIAMADVVKSARKSHRDQVMSLARSARFQELLSNLNAWIQGDWRAKASDVSVTEVADVKLTKIHKKIRRDCKSIGLLCENELHHLRIEAKKARYAAEFLSAIYRDGKEGRRLKRYQKIVRTLLKALGGLTDMVGQREPLQEFLKKLRKGLPEATISDLEDRWAREEQAARKMLMRDARLSAKAFRKVSTYW